MNAMAGQAGAAFGASAGQAAAQGAKQQAAQAFAGGGRIEEGFLYCIPVLPGFPTKHAISMKGCMARILIAQAICCVLRFVFLKDIMGGLWMALVILVGAHGFWEGPMNITYIACWGVLCLMNGIFDILQAVLPLVFGIMTFDFISVAIRIASPVVYLLGASFAYHLYLDFAESNQVKNGWGSSYVPDIFALMKRRVEGAQQPLNGQYGDGGGYGAPQGQNYGPPPQSGGWPPAGAPGGGFAAAPPPAYPGTSGQFQQGPPQGPPQGAQQQQQQQQQMQQQQQQGQGDPNGWFSSLGASFGASAAQGAAQGMQQQAQQAYSGGQAQAQQAYAGGQAQAQQAYAGGQAQAQQAASRGAAYGQQALNQGQAYGQQGLNQGAAYGQQAVNQGAAYGQQPGSGQPPPPASKGWFS